MSQDELLERLVEGVTLMRLAFRRANLPAPTRIDVPRDTAVAVRALKEGAMVLRDYPKIERSEGYCVTICGIDIVMERAEQPRLTRADIEMRCRAFADYVVPRYRDSSKRPLSCTGRVAKQWQAAWDGACLALGSAPEQFRPEVPRD